MSTKRQVVAVVTVCVLTFASQLGIEGQTGQQTPPPQPEFGSEDVMTAAPVMPPFDVRYFVGEWEIEWLPPDLDLFPGGKYSGVEKIEQVANRHHLKLEVELHAEGGQTMKGQGIILLDQGLSGLQLLKYVAFDRGFALFQSGPVAIDLTAASSYKHTWDVPEFTFDGTKYALKGASSFVSPAAYRVNQQVAMDGGNLMNFGILWYTKRTTEEAPAAPAR